MNLENEELRMMGIVRLMALSMLETTYSQKLYNEVALMTDCKYIVDEIRDFVAENIEKGVYDI